MHALQQGPHPRLQAVRLHPAWPDSASGSLADYLSTCQSLTLLPSGRRSKVNQYENKSLIKIEHVNDKVDTDFYMGKRYAPAPPILNSSRPSSQVSRWMTAHRSKRAAAAALVGSARAALTRGCGKNPWLPPAPRLPIATVWIPRALWMRPGCLRWLLPTLGAPADDLAVDKGLRRAGAPDGRRGSWSQPCTWEGCGTARHGPSAYLEYDRLVSWRSSFRRRSQQRCSGQPRPLLPLDAPTHASHSVLAGWCTCTGLRR